MCDELTWTARDFKCRWYLIKPQASIAKKCDGAWARNMKETKRWTVEMVLEMSYSETMLIGSTGRSCGYIFEETCQWVSFMFLIWLPGQNQCRIAHQAIQYLLPSRVPFPVPLWNVTLNQWKRDSHGKTSHWKTLWKLGWKPMGTSHCTMLISDPSKFFLK